MGLEFSGIVEEVGRDHPSSSCSSSEIFQKGDEVYGLVPGGAYAEYVLINKRMLMRKPSELSWEECAAVPEV